MFVMNKLFFNRVFFTERNMRKVLFVFMTLILPYMAYGVEVDGINYELNEVDKTAQVRNKSGVKYSGHLVIPPDIKVDEVPYTVTGIMPYAFNRCDNLESVSIPESVTALYEWTFLECYSLDTLFIHKKLTHIDYGAFRYCPSLASIVVDPENPVYDSRQGCNAIIMKDNDTLILGCKATVIPEGVSYIGDYAFMGCDYISSISIPNSVKGIGKSTFASCNNLTDINIPEGLTEICSGAFFECFSLESISIPKSVTYIDENAFDRCSVISSIVVDKDNAFYDSRQDCNAIIETASDKLIAGGLATVIPNDVKSLGSESFSQRDITSITIPGNVEVIGTGAFYYCQELTSVTILEGVKSIGEMAFMFDESLVSVTIPSTVTGIGSSAFSICDNLKEFTCLADTPPVCSKYTFGNLAECTLMVPENSISLYEADAVWGNFGHIVKIGGTTGVAHADLDNLSIQVNDGVLIISGLQDGERVSAYTMDGVLQGTATAIAGTASLNLPKGSVLLVRSSDESGISLLVE